MYTRKLNDGSLIILVLYIDDMIITSKSKDEITLLKDALSKQFAMRRIWEMLIIFLVCVSREIVSAKYSNFAKKSIFTRSCSILTCKGEATKYPYGCIFKTWQE